MYYRCVFSEKRFEFAKKAENLLVFFAFVFFRNGVVFLLLHAVRAF